MAKSFTAFFMVITDSENMVFNVVGPVTDDSEINSQVVKAQEDGKHVNCHASSAGTQLGAVAEVEKDVNTRKFRYDPNFQL